MRIALVGARNFPAKHGGLEVAVEKLGLELAKRGHDVHIFVGQGMDACAEGLHVHRSSSVATKHLHTLSQVMSAVPAVRRLHADVVHVHGVGPALPLNLGPGVFRAPTIVTAHGIDWERSKWGAAAAWFFRLASLRALKRASAVTAVSRAVADSVGSSLGSGVSFVANGVEVARLGTPLRELPTKFSVAVGRLTPEKRMDWLVENYSDDVANKYGPLVVVGSGASSHSEEYEKHVRSVATDNVIFAGSLTREDTLATVARASVFISASGMEAQPISVMEAMMLRIPLCLSDISAHTELAEEGATYFSPNSRAEFLRALEGTVGDSTRIERSSRIVEELTWAVAAERYEEFYENVQSKRTQ